MSKGQTTIGFTGDLAFCDYFADGYKRTDILDADVKAFMDSCDYNVINVESTITPCRFKSAKGNGKRCGFEALDFFNREIKSPILSFANNRVMDYSRIGTVDTIEGCKAAGIPCIGIGMDIFKACDFALVGEDVKVAVLAIGYHKRLRASKGNGGPLFEGSTGVIRETIEKMRDVADLVVIYYHGGDRYTKMPMPYTRHKLKKYLKLGADVVIATHPHIVQGYEMVGDKAIFYSLGDFIIDNDTLREVEGTEEGMLLKLVATKTGFTFESKAVHLNREKETIENGTAVMNRISETEYRKSWPAEAGTLLHDREERYAKRQNNRELFQAEKEKEREIVQAIQLEAEGKIDEALLVDETEKKESFNKKFKRFTDKYFGDKEGKMHRAVLMTGTLMEKYLKK